MKYPGLTTGCGNSDTHALKIKDRKTGKPVDNPHPSRGLPYGTVTFEGIVAMAGAPEEYRKMQGPWIIPSTYVAHDARNHTAQRENGQFWMLIVDIDDGNHTQAAVVDAIQTVIGPVEFLIYSSPSSRERNKKHKAVIPLGHAIPGADFPGISQAFYRLIDAQGFTCDQVPARTGQLTYLPTTDPTEDAAKEAAHGPKVYEYKHHDGDLLTLTDAHPIIVEWKRYQAMLDQMQRDVAAKRQQKLEELKARGGAPGERPGDAFNQAHTIEDLFHRYGYQQSGPNWQSPIQAENSKNFSTIISDDGQAWISLSGSDTEAGLGARHPTGCYGDAFDLFRYFEHGNDFTAAARAYGVQMLAAQMPPAGAVPGMLPPGVPQPEPGPSQRGQQLADRIDDKLTEILPGLPLVDAHAIDRMIWNTIYSGAKNRFAFVHKQGGWSIYLRNDAWQMMCRRFGTPLPAEAVETALMGMDIQSNAEREQILKAVSSAVRGTIESEIMFSNQRDRLEWLVDPFTTESSITIGEVIATITLPHRAYAETPFNEEYVADFRQHFPEFDEMLRWLVACRFARDRKQSYLWIYAASDFGKGLIFGLLQDLGAVVKMSVREIESALEGKPLGKAPEDFTRAQILWVDEFKTVKSELKELQNDIQISPKFGLQSKVQLYAKVFTSAEDVKSLTGERGVEKQFLNRMALLQSDYSVKIRPVYKAKRVAYADSLRGYMAKAINDRTAEFVAMGRDAAAEAAQIELETFLRKYNVGATFGDLSENLEDLAKDLHRYIWANEDQLRLNQHLVTRSLADGGQTFLRHPAKVLEMFLEETVGRAERTTLARLSTDILKHLSADPDLKDQEGYSKKYSVKGSKRRAIMLLDRNDRWAYGVDDV